MLPSLCFAQGIMSDFMNEVRNMDAIEIARGGHIVLKVVKQDRNPES